MFYQLLNINIFIFKLKNFNIHQFIFFISTHLYQHANREEKANVVKDVTKRLNIGVKDVKAFVSQG